MMIISGQKVAAAWVAARAAIGGTVAKDGKANYGKYATLAAVMDAITPALAANKLAIVQEAELNDSAVTVAATLLHESGETIEFVPLTMPTAQRTAQAVGSAITYARRYQLVGLFGLAPDDDDGEAATAPKPAQRPQTTRAAQTSQHTAPVPNGAQRPPQAPTEASAQDTSAALKKMHAIGHDVWGADWDKVRESFVVDITGGAHTSSKDLMPAELSHIITVLETEQIAKRTQGENWRKVYEKISAKFEADDLEWSAEQHKQARVWLNRKRAVAADDERRGRGCPGRTAGRHHPLTHPPAGRRKGRQRSRCNAD